MNGNRTLLKKIGSVALVLLFTLLLSGCPNLFGSDNNGNGNGNGDNDDNGGDGTSETYRSATTNLESDLGSAGLTDAQIQAITEGAVGSLTEGELTDSEDSEAVLTTMISGSQSALTGDDFTDEERLAAIEAIVGSAVGSLSNGGTSASSVIRASQTQDILGALVQASVSGIDDAGFTADGFRRQAAGRSTGGAVSNLGRAGVSSELAVSSVRRIAESGVSALGDGGYTAGDVGETVRFLTRGTMGNVDDTGIAGVDIELELRSFGREVSRGVTSNLGRGGVVTSANSGSALTGVSRGATGALQDIDFGGDAATLVNDLTNEVSRGVSESLSALRADITDLDIQTSVRTVVRGTTEGLSDLGSDVRFGTTVITAETFNTVVRAASAGGTLSARQANVGLTDLAGDLEAEIETLSQEITALQSQLEQLQTQIETLVSEGIAQADNEAPTAAVSATRADGTELTNGATIDAGTTVTITGTATDTVEDDDADDGFLDVRVTLRGPDGAELDSERNTELTGSNALTASLTSALSRPGTYRVTVFVSDGIDSDSVSFSITTEDNLTTADQNAIMARGVSFLEQGYVNDALNDFQTLYDADSNYVPGALAYSLVDMATVLTDEEVVSFARDTLGLVEYPTRVADILNFDFWMRSVYDPSSETFVLFPRVANQTDRDGDGVVDPGERLTQIAENMIAASATNDDLIDLFAGQFGDKLDALQTRVGGIDASDGFAITSDMVFQSAAEASSQGWPADDSGELVEFTIGTAELNVVLATGRLVQFLNQWGQAISLQVNYDYYLFDDEDKFRLIFDESEIPENGYFYDFPALGPLAENSFLESRADAETHLAAAGDAFVTMLDTIAGAMDDISGRAADSEFFVNADSVEQALFGGDPESTLTNPTQFLQDVATVFENLADDVTASFDAGGGTLAYLPVPSVALDGAEPEEYFETYADSWPTSTSGVTTDGVLAFDFGLLFGTSIGGISGIFELDSDTREPVLYKYSNPASVTRLTTLTDTVSLADVESAAKTASFTAATGYSAATDDATSIYFARIPDATLGMVPDAITQTDLDDFNTDVNIWTDYEWDNETLTEVEGSVFEGHEVFARFDPDDESKVEVFIRVPTEFAGHLYVEKDATFDAYDWPLEPDSELETHTSLGSFWWGVLADFLPEVGEYYGGNSQETATPIPTESLAEVTAVDGEILWYEASVDAGLQYTITLDDWDQGPLYDTDVYFQGYNSDGTQLFTRDSGSVTVTAPADGVIFITIDGTEWNDSGPVGITVVTSGGETTLAEDASQ